MIDLFGVTIHDPDVALTDFGLAALGSYLGLRLWNAPGPQPLRAPGALILAGLAVAALGGGIYHGFFPAGTTTAAGYVAWLPVPLSIAVVSATLLDLSIGRLLPRLSRMVSRGVVLAYALAFAAVTLFIDESFRTIVLFYAPALLLFLVTAAWQAARQRSRGWMLITMCFVVSGIAASFQQANVGLHPDYFDHNALYHLLQAIAMVLLYKGFRHLSLEAPA